MQRMRGVLYSLQTCLVSEALCAKSFCDFVHNFTTLLKCHNGCLWAGRSVEGSVGRCHPLILLVRSWTMHMLLSQQAQICSTHPQARTVSTSARRPNSTLMLVWSEGMCDFRFLSV